jgi:uncharacterized protein YjeT (DUF2065 family)
VDVWLSALGLVMVIEGLLPFAAPMLWRDTFRRLLELSDGQLRGMGLFSIAAGLLVLYLIR